VSAGAERDPSVRRGVLAVGLAALVAGAGLYGGATDALGRAGLATLAAGLALSASITMDAGRSAHGRRVALAIGALALLAALQSLPIPDALSRTLAPLAHASRDEALGTSGGVAVSLDVAASRRAATLLLAFAVLLAAVAPRLRGGAVVLLARALCVTAIGHAVLALLVGRYTQERAILFGGFEVANPYQAFGSFPNRTQFAAFETVLLGAAFVLIARPRGAVLDRVLGALGVAGAAAGTWASGSRAGVAGVALAILVAGLGDEGRVRRRRAAGVALAVLVAVAFAIARPPSAPALLRGDEALRLDIWRGSAALCARQPVAGVGIDAFAAAYAGEGRRPTDRLVTVAENDLLHAAAEGGIAGLAALSFGLVALVRGWRGRMRAADPDARRAGRLALAGPIGLLPTSLTSVPLHAPAVALASLCAGMLAVALLRGNDDPRACGYAPVPGVDSEAACRAS